MRYIILLGISSLLLSNVTNVTAAEFEMADCVTTFDQECLISHYDQKAADDNHNRQQLQQMELNIAYLKHMQAEAEAQQDERKETREDNQLIVEVEHTKAARRQATALEGIRREHRD